MGPACAMTTVPGPSTSSGPFNAPRSIPVAAPPDSIGNGLDYPRRAFAIGGILSAMAMVVIDGGLSNVALPTLAVSLRVTPSDAILVITAYQAAVVMTLLPSAALGERFGYRSVFALGVGLFSAKLLASALSPSLPWLIAARFAQGLGGAAVLALGVALLRFQFPMPDLALRSAGTRSPSPCRRR